MKGVGVIIRSSLSINEDKNFSVSARAAPAGGCNDSTYLFGVDIVEALQSAGYSHLNDTAHAAAQRGVRDDRFVIGFASREVIRGRFRIRSVFHRDGWKRCD